MKKHLLSALGCLACVLALAAAAVLPYRAMLAQDAARLSSPHPIPGGAPAGGLCEAGAQSAAAQALYGRMRVLGEANAGSAAAQPAEFDESLLAGAADALFGAGALPQVYALWARDGSFQALEDAGPTQGHALVDEFGFFSLSHRALSATYAPGNSAVVAFCAAFTHEAAGLPAGVDWEACARNYAAHLGLAAVDDWQAYPAAAPGAEGCRLYSPGAQLLLSVGATPSVVYPAGQASPRYDIYLRAEARSLSPGSAQAYLGGAA